MKHAKTSPRIPTGLTTPRGVLAILAMILAAGAFASPAPPPPIDELTAFYQAMDGDNWARNDHWLDEDVHHCNWYGIRCNFSISTSPIDGILLPGNNLTGDIAEVIDLLDDLLRLWGRVDLSGNNITGELPILPLAIPVVKLADNALTGPLPKVPDGDEFDLEELDLSRNTLSGEVPESWSGLELRGLNLADNRLEGGYLNTFKAMSRVDWSWLDLAGNDFTGELTTDIFAAKLNRRENGNVGGGLNVCFNDFIIDTPDVEQWIADRHVGGPDYHQCLARERLTVDASVSGSWYHPERSGEGISLMLLGNSSPLLYHFGFDTEGRQQWLFEVGTAGEQYMQWNRLLETQGTFNAGLRYDGEYPFIRSVARFRLNRVGADELHLHRHYHDLSGCREWDEADPNRPPGPGLCFPSLISDRMDYQRLSGLAGATCDDQGAWGDYSGAWYNPERSGEGFIVEVLPGEKAVVYWFTHKPDGSGEQAWMIAQGEISHKQSVVLSPTPVVVIDSAMVYQPLGGVFGPSFNPDDIDTRDWGRLTIEFHTKQSGHVEYESLHEDYGSGAYPIERLARPMLAECDGGGDQS